MSSLTTPPAPVPALQKPAAAVLTGLLDYDHLPRVHWSVGDVQPGHLVGQINRYGGTAQENAAAEREGVRTWADFLSCPFVEVEAETARWTRVSASTTVDGVRVIVWALIETDQETAK